MTGKGRPTDFTNEKAELICALITEGQTIRTICRNNDMPSIPTFYSWLRTQPDFLKQYGKAKQEQVDAMAEELLDIADDGSNDWIDKLDSDGSVIGKQLNSEHIQRSRLRVDTRKFLMSKMKPKKYGDKIDINSTGELTINVNTGILKPPNSDD